ncbi:MAG TPA: hypothetical protein VNW54_10435 [Granulicella sp.]|jgi:hypothetical protein|nr:hypothetical protein [Granulicella sp.]
MRVIAYLSLVSLLATPLLQARSRQEPVQPQQIVAQAVAAELAAAQNDRSLWRYRDERKDQHDSISIVVQTGLGAVTRLVARAGHPLSPSEAETENNRVNNFIHDPSQLARQRKDGAQDDRNARELLNMLPTAFLWRIESEDAQTWHLHFEPNPNFSPPSLQARVLSAMNGEMVVDKTQHRIETISGRLIRDVTFGFGLFGRLRAGGTFRVERRQLAPGLWQITETHVHIDGKALFFKNISQEQDEVQIDFTPVSDDTTLEQAAQMTRPEAAPSRTPAVTAAPQSHRH